MTTLDRDAVRCGGQLTYLAPAYVPGQGELAGEVEATDQVGVWVAQGNHRYRVPWADVTGHLARSPRSALPDGTCLGTGQSWVSGDQDPAVHGPNPAPAVCPVCRYPAAAIGGTATRMPAAGRWRGVIPAHEQCSHTRGAISLDDGGWHCYQCQAIVFDPGPAPGLDSPPTAAQRRLLELVKMRGGQATIAGIIECNAALGLIDAGRLRLVSGELTPNGGSGVVAEVVPGGVQTD